MDFAEWYREGSPSLSGEPTASIELIWVSLLSVCAMKIREAVVVLSTTSSSSFLGNRFAFKPELWSYSIYHKDESRMREYLPHTSLANRSGLWLKSQLLDIDPVVRGSYQHLEYKPLSMPCPYSRKETQDTKQPFSTSSTTTSCKSSNISISHLQGSASHHLLSSSSGSYRRGPPAL